MLLSMSKVQIIGPKKLFYDTLNVLHYIGALQLEDLSQKIEPGDMLMRKMEVDEEAKKNHDELESLLGRIGAILAAVKPDTEDNTKYKKEIEEEYDRIWRSTCRDLATDCNEVIKKLDKITRDLATNKQDLEREFASLSKYENIVKKLYPLAPQLYRMEGFEAIALLINKKYASVLELMRKEMAKITKNQFELISAEIDQDTIATILLFKSAYSEVIHNFLWAEKVNQIHLPESLADKPFEDILDHIQARKAEIPHEISKIQEKLNDTSEKWYVRLLVLKQTLRDRLEELEVPSQMGQTDFTFVINGWIPTNKLDVLKKMLTDEFDGNLHFEELKPSPKELEEAPVVFENPSLVKPFELIMNIFPPPRYGTIDPTPFIAMFFPILFGMIVGDIGIGAVILLVTLALRFRYKNKAPWVKSVTTIFIMGSLSAIMFGFLYGEAFGNLLELNHVIREIHIFGIPLPLNRLHMIVPMLLLSIGVGAVQIVFGLVLGLINAIKGKARKHAIEKIGMLIVLFGMFLIIAALSTSLDALMTPAYFGILIGVVLLVYSAGFMGVVEIFGTLSNIFSYTRILAIGLAGAILAMVANQLVGSMGSIYIGITVGLLLHALNIVIATFSPAIHSLRLNLVEFSNQFVESGGSSYKPFKRTGGE